MHQQQIAVSAWAEATFGSSPSAMIVAARLNTEVAELLRAVAHGTSPAHLAAIEDEIADVQIMLWRLASVVGCDVDEAARRKMIVNRQRRWHVAGDGTGRHVREEARA